MIYTDNETKTYEKVQWRCLEMKEVLLAYEILKISMKETMLVLGYLKRAHVTFLI